MGFSTTNLDLDFNELNSIYTPRGTNTNNRFKLQHPEEHEPRSRSASFVQSYFLSMNDTSSLGSIETFANDLSNFERSCSTPRKNDEESITESTSTTGGPLSTIKDVNSPWGSPQAIKLDLSKIKSKSPFKRTNDDSPSTSSKHPLDTFSSSTYGSLLDVDRRNTPRITRKIDFSKLVNGKLEVTFNAGIINRHTKESLEELANKQFAEGCCSILFLHPTRTYCVEELGKINFTVFDSSAYDYMEEVNQDPSDLSPLETISTFLIVSKSSEDDAYHYQGSFKYNTKGKTYIPPFLDNLIDANNRKRRVDVREKACLRLGLMYGLGIETERNLSEAYRYISSKYSEGKISQLQAETFEIQAKYVLGMYHSYQINDIPKAKHFYSQAITFLHGSSAFEWSLLSLEDEYKNALENLTNVGKENFSNLKKKTFNFPPTFNEKYYALTITKLLETKPKKLFEKIANLEKDWEKEKKEISDKLATNKLKHKQLEPNEAFQHAIIQIPKIGEDLSVSLWLNCIKGVLQMQRGKKDYKTYLYKSSEKGFLPAKALLNLLDQEENQALQDYKMVWVNHHKEF